MRRTLLLALLFLGGPAAAFTCGGVVAPGLAYPDAGGIWRGVEIDLCTALAKRIGAAPVFSPVFQDSDTPPAGRARSVMFLPAGDIPAGYASGMTIFNDHQAIMVPVWSTARNAAELGRASICVEPGSPEDFNLTAYFAAHHIALQEFVFQETDEMRDAYVAGRCDAITARISLLQGLRANETGARRGDVLLPDDLGDNPVRVATPAGQTAWAEQVQTIIKEHSNEAPARN